MSGVSLSACAVRALARELRGTPSDREILIEQPTAGFVRIEPILDGPSESVLGPDPYFHLDSQTGERTEEQPW